jgi:putative nucleotidyltransferase with HDIG domain
LPFIAHEVPSVAAHPRSLDTVLEDTWFAEDEAAIEAKAKESAAALVARVHAVRAFPAAAKELARRAGDPDASVAEIASILEQDPGLAARVLRLVNSEGFGLSTRCKTVLHAVSTVGITRIRELALAACAFDVFDADKAASKLVVEHSLAVAAVAKRLSLRFSVRSDDVYTCALLHDLGKLMMLDAEQDSYGPLLAAYDHAADGMHVAERAAYGFDHAVLAGLMLEAWHIPHPIPQVVGFHHTPGRVSECPPSTATMLHLLRVADVVAHGAELDVPPSDLLARLDCMESAVALDLTGSDLAAMWPALMKAVRGSRLEEPEPVSEEAPPSSRRVVKTRRDVPVLACAECGHHTDGKLCPRCVRPLCRAHAVDRGCCALCEAEFRRPTPARSQIVQRFREAGASATAGTVVAMTGYLFRHATAGRIALSGGVALVLVGGMFAFHALYRRWRLRARFLGSLVVTGPPRRLRKP